MKRHTIMKLPEAAAAFVAILWLGMLRCLAALPAALQPRHQSVYGWLLLVKG